MLGLGKRERFNPGTDVFKTCIADIALKAPATSISSYYIINELMMPNVLRHTSDIFIITKILAFGTVNSRCKAGATNG